MTSSTKLVIALIPLTSLPFGFTTGSYQSTHSQTAMADTRVWQPTSWLRAWTANRSLGAAFHSKQLVEYGMSTSPPCPLQMTTTLHHW